MKAIILAAGRSQRMQPVADKPLIKFMGKTLLEKQIEMLQEHGFEDLIVIGGAHNLADFGRIAGQYQNVEVVEQVDLEDGMRGAVLAVSDRLGGEPVLVFNCNDLVDPEVLDLVVKAYEVGDADIYMAGKQVEEYFPGGYLKTDENDYVHGIVEKPEPGTEPSDLVNLVVHLFKKPLEFVRYLEGADSEQDDSYEVALDNMMNDGVLVKAVRYSGFWQAIKFPWHLQQAFVGLMEGRGQEISGDADVAEGVVIKGDVVIEPGVRVFEGAVIKGPAYIGANTVIANNSLVRDSHVGADCVIGFNTEVARSFLFDQVWTHSNYVGDSVIGNNVSFGAGTVTGNFRLDEGNIMMNIKGKKQDTGSNKFGMVTGDNIRVGVNTSFMPGIKIGGGSFIGAGIVVAEDVPERSFVRGDWSIKVSENKCEIDPGARDEIKKNLNN